MDYYIDLLVTAFNCVNRGNRKDRDFFLDLLLNEYVTFCENVIEVYNENLKSHQ